MKTYIVYVDGEEQSEPIKAGSHNAAEKKARKKYGGKKKIRNIFGESMMNKIVSVAYTEL